MNTENTELTAAQEQLSKALGLDHEQLLANGFITRLANPEASRPPWEHAWIARLREILPGPAEAVEVLYPCPSQDHGGDPELQAYPCSVCVATDHEWELDDQFNQAEADCQAIAEKLAELLAAVPGPIREVCAIPSRHDSNLAEVEVPRTSQQEEGQ